jgi:alpha-N-acetylglucosamine transferase
MSLTLCAWLLHCVAPVIRIQPVAVTANPNAGFQSRLVFVYTKLLIFNMVEYDRVVFLDSDTLVRHHVYVSYFLLLVCNVKKR